VLRTQPGVFGPVASDPTVSRLIARLAGDPDAALEAITAARTVARERVWNWAGAPVQDGQVVVDLDATLVTPHSEKQDATRTWKKTFGFHPLLGFVDYGPAGHGPAAPLPDHHPEASTNRTRSTGTTAEPATPPTHTNPTQTTIHKHGPKITVRPLRKIEASWVVRSIGRAADRTCQYSLGLRGCRRSGGATESRRRSTPGVPRCPRTASVRPPCLSTRV
jgi:hypothetical protein